jgi:hypothetical protein
MHSLVGGVHDIFAGKRGGSDEKKKPPEGNFAMSACMDLMPES